MKTRHFVLSLFCLFVLMAAPAMAADAASAPAPVAVLDMEAVVKNSVAGKGLQKELKARMDKIKAEAEAFKKDMADKEKALVAKYKESGDPKAVEAERKKFADELKASQKKIIDENVALEKSKLAAIGTIQQNIAKVAADIADERKIQIVVDRKFVVIAEQSLDISEEVLKRLDGVLKSAPLK